MFYPIALGLLAIDLTPCKSLETEGQYILFLADAHIFWTFVFRSRSGGQGLTNSYFEITVSGKKNVRRRCQLLLASIGEIKIIHRHRIRRHY